MKPKGRPTAVPEKAGKEKAEKTRGKSRPPPIRIKPHFHHRRKAHLCRFGTQSPLRRRSRCPRDRTLLPPPRPPTPISWLVVKPLTVNRLQARATRPHGCPGRCGDPATQPSSRGQKLVYTAADDKFVLTGGPPSIFDAEQGKITGVSLTFFRRDDRVLVEGEASTPVVTQTRVAR